MSMSDEERVEGIMFAIKHMVQAKHEFVENQNWVRFGTNRIIGLVEKAWSAFLGQESNGAHWILGSSATREVNAETCTPWGVAIKSHCERLLSKESGIIKDGDDVFNAFNGFLDIKGLLHNSGNGNYFYYEIMHGQNRSSIICEDMMMIF